MNGLSKGERLGLAFFAQIAFLLAGVTVLAAWFLRGGTPDGGHLAGVVGVSALPWFVTALNLLRDTSAGDAVRVNPAELTREEIRAIPVFRSRVPLYCGIDQEDLMFFVRRICETRDWRQRSWRNVVMPSGCRCTNEMHRKLCRILEQAGFIVGRQPRSTGQLVTRNPDTVFATLGLVDSRKAY